ncbi:MAG TPA: hypothetical protein VMA09_06365 [Candidatus Binataceae bacterium]|nr:hypothetical protein [Candidatus Binataceae bacterium]
MIKGTTLVIGLGEVGGALAQVLERSQRIVRHDIQPVEINEEIGVAHLCFPFHSSEQYETTAIDYLRRFSPKLAVINSTVTPGTTRRIAAATSIPTAFSPVRGKHVQMTQDLVRYCKFVAAPDIATARAAEEHFEQAGMKTRRINGVDALEMAKLAETTYFGVLIAYAQELNRYCEKVGGDYYELTNFFDEIEFLPRVRYFPGFIGGHCVIPNINLMLKVAPSPILQAVLDSNERRAAEVAGKDQAQKPLQRVAISSPGDSGKTLAAR